MVSTATSLLPPREFAANEMPPPKAATPAMAPAPMSRFLRVSRTWGVVFFAETPLATWLNAGPNPWDEALENPPTLFVFAEGRNVDLLCGAEVENPCGAALWAEWAPRVLPPRTPALRLWELRDGRGVLPGMFCLRLVGTYSPEVVLCRMRIIRVLLWGIVTFGCLLTAPVRAIDTIIANGTKVPLARCAQNALLPALWCGGSSQGPRCIRRYSLHKAIRYRSGGIDDFFYERKHPSHPSCGRREGHS